MGAIQAEAIKKILKEVQSWAPSFEQRPHPAMIMHSVSLLLELLSGSYFSSRLIVPCVHDGQALASYVAKYRRRVCAQNTSWEEEKGREVS